MSDRAHVSVDEFSRRSGLAAVTIRRYLRRGHLPYVQPGGRKHRILIPVNALEKVTGTDSVPPASPTPPPPSPPPRPGRKPGWMAGPRPA